MEPKAIESDEKLAFSGEEDEQALLAEEPEETQDHGITDAHVIAPETMWEAIQGLQKKVDLLAGTPQTRINDASLTRRNSLCRTEFLLPRFSFT